MTRRSLALVLLLLTALVAGCGTPGGDSGDNDKAADEAKKNSAKIDVAKAGDVTLTIWDQEVRGGQAAQIKRLNAAFLRQYPNVKIKRVAKSFTDLQTTLKLAVSGPNPPDIVEANQGRPIMGQLVKGGLLKPLDAYAEAYGWRERWSKTLLDLNRFSADGKQFGSGNLYGVSQQGEIVGVFYNKAKVGAPAEDVRGVRGDARQGEARTARRRSRSATSTSSAASTSSRPSRTCSRPRARRATSCSPRTARRSTPRRTARPPRSSRTGPTRATSPRTSTASATTRRGSSSPRARARSRSRGPGSRLDALKGLGDKLGFFLMPGREAGSEPVSLGGESLPWAITSKSKNADVAAAYLDFITNQKAADVQVETDNLPAMQPTVEPKTPAQKEIFAAWKQLNDTDGLTPYMDYATPTFFDDFSGAVQRLLGGKLTPEAFTKGVQEDYAKFTDTL